MPGLAPDWEAFDWRAAYTAQTKKYVAEQQHDAAAIGLLPALRVYVTPGRNAAGMASWNRSNYPGCENRRQ